MCSRDSKGCPDMPRPWQAKQPVQTLLAYHSDGSRVTLSQHPLPAPKKLEFFMDLSHAEKAYLDYLDSRDNKRVASRGCDSKTMWLPLPDWSWWYFYCSFDSFFSLLLQCTNSSVAAPCCHRFLRKFMKSRGWTLTRWCQTRLELGFWILLRPSRLLGW